MKKTATLERELNHLRDKCSLLSRLIWEANGERGKLVGWGHTGNNRRETVLRWTEEVNRELDALTHCYCTKREAEYASRS